MSLAALGAVASFIACLALTPVVRRACIRFGAVDRPGPLKIHARPVPRLGGIAVALSIATGILISAGHDANTNAYLFAGLATIWIAGLADDLWNISPYLRLAAQIISGIFIWSGGWRFAPGNVSPQTGVFSAVFVCGLIVLLANSWNFWDGSDGLAAGVAAIVGAAYLAISQGAPKNHLTTAVAAGLAGSCAAFLFFNFYPRATIFLGDSGSTVFGFSIALLVLRPPHAAPVGADVTLAPLLMSSLPLIDACLAIARRLRSGVSPFTGDRRHAYDLLLARGWTSHRVALLCCGITGLLAAGAWLGVGSGTYGFLAISILGAVGVLLFEFRLGALRPERRDVRANQIGKFGVRDEVGSPS